MNDTDTQELKHLPTPSPQEKGMKINKEKQLENDIHLTGLGKSRNAKDCGDLTVLPLGYLPEIVIAFIHQAIAEDRERVEKNIRYIYDNYHLDQKAQTSDNPKIVLSREMFIVLLFSPDTNPKNI